MLAPPSLLFVTTLPPDTNGASRHSTWLLSGLARRGYGVHAIAPVAPASASALRDHAAAIGIGAEALALDDAKLDWRDPPSLDAFCRDARAAAAVLPAAIARHHASAIIVAASNLVPGIPDIARGHGVPCVVIAHNILNRKFGGGFRDDVADFLLGEYRKANQVIAIADHVGASYRRSGMGHVACVPNSVDTTMFCPGRSTSAMRARVGAGENDLVVLHASNMRAVKRPQDVLAAAARSLRQEPRLRFVIAGDDPEPAKTRRTINEIGIADRVCVLGPVDPTDMPDLYRLADIVLQPSSSEGRSLVCLEALSAGCVLLASDIPASSEIVIGGETGFVFPVGDVNTMTDLILGSAADADLRERIGRSARAWSLQQPSLDDRVEAFAGLFDAVVAPLELTLTEHRM